MLVKTINLEAAVEWAKLKLRDLLDDPVDLFEQFDRVVAVSRLSVSEGHRAGIRAYYSMHECAGAAIDADRAEKLDCVANAYLNDLRVWYVEAHRAELEDRKTWRNDNTCAACVARWESRDGKYWVELWQGPYDYQYHCDNGCGSVCNPNLPLESATLVIQSMLDRGWFLPDAAKLPMKRVL